MIVIYHRLIIIIVQFGKTQYLILAKIMEPRFGDDCFFFADF